MKTLSAMIDFGTSKVVTLVAESGANRRCDIIGSGVIPYDGYMEGYWNREAKVTEAIHASVSEAEKQSGRRIMDLHVGVPGEFCRVYVAETTVQLQGVDPSVSSADVERLFREAEASLAPLRGVIIHRAPAWFVVDDGKKTMEPVGIKGEALKSLICFIVADEFFLSDINRRMTELNITVKGFFSSPMGEAHLFLPPEERDKCAVLIDVGYLNTEIMVVEGDALIFHKVIPMGGAHITLDLTYGLDIPMPMAEQIKRGYVFLVASENTVDAVDASGRSVSFTREDVARVLEPRVDEIAELIGDALSKSGVRLGTWSGVYLTGGGLALMRGGREYLQHQLGKAVRQPQARTTKLTSPVYASALGLLDLVLEITEQQGGGGGLKTRLSRLFGK